MAGLSERVSAAIAYVCGNLPDLRAQLDHLGDRAPLDRLLAAIRDGSDVTRPLDDLHEALLAGGDVLGVYGGSARSVRLAGITAAAPPETLYTCPHRRCARYQWPEPGASAAPTCEIDETSMLLERLP
ncbi:hypothetical protein ACFPOI_31335 [Nonomuraea angiospora]|uniref:Uncharacterized protein n=1 Tax=Nonomuraea angiospora TaxID=46172 RepID=A0ABR9LNV1_9ACTN|nr:hypothetical protein [Nonomuraea angiospora]MBE1582331.1 hypothetical protein [Nonomuraea angiospora]